MLKSTKWQNVMRNTLAASCIFFNIHAFASSQYTQEALLPYKTGEMLFGNLSTVGSDTLANLMSQWAMLFKSFYPKVNVQIQTSGSASAFTALYEATAQIGSMSRALNEDEKAQFIQRYGYPPQEIKVATDVLALYVNQDNPIQSISPEAVDAIYSRSPSCTLAKKIQRWGELGLTGAFANKPIALFGRNSISGTYVFFKNTLLCGVGYRDKVNQLASSQSVIQAVSHSVNAIGYAGIGHQAAGVKMLALEIKGKKIQANIDNVLSGAYPLSRYLYVYVNKKPNEPLAQNEAEFIKLMLSKQGQALVKTSGFIPLSKKEIDQQLQLLTRTDTDILNIEAPKLSQAR